MESESKERKGGLDDFLRNKSSWKMAGVQSLSDATDASNVPKKDKDLSKHCTKDIDGVESAAELDDGLSSDNKRQCNTNMEQSAEGSNEQFFFEHIPDTRENSDD